MLIIDLGKDIYLEKNKLWHQSIHNFNYQTKEKLHFIYLERIEKIVTTAVANPASNFRGLEIGFDSYLKYIIKNNHEVVSRRFKPEKRRVSRGGN